MKNKKGFTLIELLAVIAILALLVVFAVPNIIKMFGDSKKKAFVTEAQSVFKTAESALISKQLSNPTTTIRRFYSENDSDKLDLSKSDNLKYCIKVENGKIKSIAITNGEYWYINDDVSQISEIDTSDDTKFGTGSKTISCSSSGTADLDAVQNPLYTALKTLGEEGNYATTYSGSSNDTYGETGTETIYYIKPKSSAYVSDLLNKINVKFGGFCWQMVRTTDTGGVRLVYNGDPDSNGHCKSHATEDTHLGIVGTAGTNASFIGDFMYADTFTYDSNGFTLVSPRQDNWSTNKNLVGKYTCKSSSSTCTTIYLLHSPVISNANKAYYSTYIVGDTQNAQIGTSSFNSNISSLAYSGYKYGNTVYASVGTTAPTDGVIMGHDVYWNGTNYVLKDTDNNNSSHTYDSSIGPENNYHYTCNTSSATCTDGKVRYYYSYSSKNSNYYYTELKNGDKVEDAISKMLTNSENNHDSSIKSIMDNWYRINLRSYESYLDQDAVYCNDRSINALNGWSKSGSVSTSLQFNTRTTPSSFGCSNIKDRFSVRNTNAQLTYPIGLLTAAEVYLNNNYDVRKTGAAYWLGSPNYFASSANYLSDVTDTGSIGAPNGGTALGIRPVITLSPNIGSSITGNGSFTTPYDIGE